MSLKVWLPFNGDINNQGLATGTLSGTPTYATGKVTRQCLNGGTLTMPAAMTSQVFNKDAITIAFWIYNGGSTGILFGTEDMTAPNNRRFSLFQYPTTNDLHWSWQNSDSSSTFTSGVATGCITSDAWTHICATWDGTYATMYANGVQVGRSSGSCTTTDWALDTIIARASSTRLINDLRIYDNCLSVLEVRELAHGLVLHYPMNFKMGAENLFTNAGNYSSKAKINRQSSAKDGYASYPIYYNNLDTSKYYILSCECDGTLYTHNTGGVDPTKNYWTIWLYYRATAYSDSDYSSYTTPTCYNSSNLVGKIGNRYYWKIQPSYACCAVRVNTYADGTTASNVNFWNFKLEEGENLTGWIPNTASTLYSELGLDTTTVQDVSGYGYNGTHNNNLKCLSGSPRYEISTYFTPTSYIGLTSPLTASSTEFTFSWWMNTSTPSTTMCIWNGRTTTGGNIGIFILGGKIRFDDGAQHSLNYTIPTSTWEHYCITRDASNIKLYVNGVLQVTATSTAFTTCGTYATIGASSVNTKTGSGNTLTGYLSDYRIYATVLSADDIKNLYNAPIKVTNNGSVLTQGELVEG